MMADLTLKPINENDGTRYLWAIVIDMDIDYEELRITSLGSGRLRIEVEISDEDLEKFNKRINNG